MAVLLTPALVLSSFALAPAAQSQTIKPTFWGMHHNDWTKKPSVTVGAANFTTSSTYWPAIETSAGVYNWTHLDNQVAAARAAGARPMIVLGQTPQFYSPTPSSADYRTSVPDLTAWKNYVTQVAQRYGTQLDYQIWPEPNVTQNWQGTVAQMAQLTAVAATAIHQYAGKGAIVVSPAVALRTSGQRAWTLAFFKQKVGGKRIHTYIDAIAIDPFPEQKGTPEDSYAIMTSIKKSLAKIGVRTPIWNNEINYGVRGGHAATGVRYPMAKQQSFVVRTFALSAAAGMQRTYWLAWSVSPELSVNMTTSKGAATPVAKSYTTVRNWLNGTNFRGCKVKRGLWTCTATKGKHDVRRIYWAAKGRIKVPTVASSLRLENQAGAKAKLRGSRVIKVDYRPVMVASRK